MCLITILILYANKVKSQPCNVCGLGVNVIFHYLLLYCIIKWTFKLLTFVICK